MSLSFRISRASKHVSKSQLLVPLHRSFTTSLIHNCPSAGHNDESSTAVKRGKGVSRLAALKKRDGPLTSSTSKVKDKSSESTQRYILGQSDEKPIRTRFAPSPTGYLHLGSLRTALFNNLVAQATKGGEFIIRIEDTDQNRLVPDAEDRIFKDLAWAGLSWTEGPDKGGPYAPYRQSERLDTYKEHTKTLLDNGSAYRCFCKPDHLEAQKRALHEAGKSTAYPGTCRTISRDESDRRASSGEAHVVRLDSGRFGTPKFKDAIYGPFQKKEPEEDFVLMKTDGYPTYHLANVVDDHLMKITHVIRGEEWLISTPKHLALYQAFGWDPPTFAHLGLLISNDGSKLSKRNDSVNLSTYIDQNVFPMALQAWLANLGASFKRGAKTPRVLEDVSEALTFKFTRGGIKLNPQKLDFFQHEYRTLLFKTPLSEHTPLEASLIKENLLTPLINTITTTPQTTIQPRGTSVPWPTPLSPVPAITSEQSRYEYTYSILSQETSRYTSVGDVAHQLAYFFWRPPPSIYRATLSTEPINKALLSQIQTAINVPSESWTTATEDLFTNVSPEQGPDLHALLRLIAIGSPHAAGKTSRILFGVLGQEEWQYRTGLVFELLQELEKGGEQIRQQWVAESATLTANPNVKGDAVAS